MIVGLVAGVRASRRPVIEVLNERGWRTCGFGDALNAMLRVGFGFTDAELQGDQQRVVQREFGGFTVHQMRNRLAFDWGRRGIHTDIWVTAWKRALANAAPGDIIVPDVRFENEALAIRELGGQLWRVDNAPARLGDAPGANQSNIPCDATLTEWDEPAIAVWITAQLSEISHGR